MQPRVSCAIEWRPGAARIVGAVILLPVRLWYIISQRYTVMKRDTVHDMTGAAAAVRLTVALDGLTCCSLLARLTTGAKGCNLCLSL